MISQQFLSAISYSQLLLECQFDQNDKLKSSVNKTFEADELRMQPTGRDQDGYIYWYHEVIVRLHVHLHVVSFVKFHFEALIFTIF